MPFGPFILQWRAPSPNPPPPSALPKGISRNYIDTASGPLELLSAIPVEPSAQPPLFFAHGGFGCAEVWLEYMQYFAAKGIPCYAVSYRGHGKSWYPGFWRMYFTTRRSIAQDLEDCVAHVEKLEAQRRGLPEGKKVRVVMVAHSGGGALCQYALSRGMATVQGFCMLAAVPAFGSWSCYRHWAWTALIQYPYRLFHPRYILATESQVRSAFFTSDTPAAIIRRLYDMLSPYETLLAPMQCVSRFITGPDVLSSIVGWKDSESGSEHSKRTGMTSRLLVLAAEKDVLCTPAILQDTAQRYRAAFKDMVKTHKIDGPPDPTLDADSKDSSDSCGVRFRVVEGLGHHLQNHVEWEKGAEVVMEWYAQL